MDTTDILGTCEECQRFGPTVIVAVDYHGRLTWYELCAKCARRENDQKQRDADAWLRLAREVCTTAEIVDGLLGITPEQQAEIARRVAQREDARADAAINELSQ